VHQAIVEAMRHSQINAKCVALIGGSKGAELSLVLASYFSEIKAVVAIVPGSSVFTGLTIAMSTSSFTLNKQPLPFVPVPWSATSSLLIGDLRGAWEEMLKDNEAVANAAINIEKINGPLFFISATKDEMWPSTEMSEIMINRLEDNNFPYYFEHVAIEGDHSAPLNHFDKIEAFLYTHFKQDESNNCFRAQ
jgi:esterase/lipase